MRVVSLFAGIGGFDLALTRQGHQIVWANEWDKYASETYKKNFKQTPDTRDIRTIKTTDIPDHDLLVGGFPCQAFSIAGKRRGFAETRGTLFFEIARILKDKKPKYFILENVKGLLFHDNGNTFKTIITTLTELGYDLEWQVLNSKNFGVPQNRERVFIIGHLRGTSRPQVFPIQGSLTEDSNSEKSKISQALTSNYYKTPNAGNYIRRQPLKFLQRNQKNIDGDYAFTVDGANTGGVMVSKTIRVGGAKSPFGSKQNWDSYLVDGAIRRLTPTECERLQGFPDNWTEGVSDTQRYKQLGNAVTVNVVEEIVRRFIV